MLSVEGLRVPIRGLRGHYVETITSASYVGLIALGLHAGQQAAWVICLGLMALIALVAWVSASRRARAIAELATSRVGSAAQGYVELYGRASVDPDNLIKSPLSGMSCIWYHYRVYAKENGDREWREISNVTSDATFEIRDGTGACRVDPDDAEVIAPERRVTYQNGYKQVEDMLFGGGLIYVLGEFTTVGGAHSALSLSEDVGALLAEWKKDPARLKRFDLDANGEIDIQEWELARRLATRTVEKQHRDIRAGSGVHVMRAPRNGRLFLISSLSPQKLRQRYLLWSFFHLGVFIFSTAAVVWL